LQREVHTLKFVEQTISGGLQFHFIIKKPENQEKQKRNLLKTGLLLAIQNLSDTLECIFLSKVEDTMKEVDSC